MPNMFGLIPAFWANIYIFACFQAAVDTGMDYIKKYFTTFIFGKVVHALVDSGRPRLKIMNYLLQLDLPSLCCGE